MFSMFEYLWRGHVCYVEIVVEGACPDQLRIEYQCSFRAQFITYIPHILWVELCTVWFGGSLIPGEYGDVTEVRYYPSGRGVHWP
uniref:Uncharacterized protein n=1 Tax=Arundo donax TaxID=35708 RepID=A0A0A9AJM7_ARUDO